MKTNKNHLLKRTVKSCQTGKRLSKERPRRKQMRRQRLRKTRKMPRKLPHSKRKEMKNMKSFGKKLWSRRQRRLKSKRKRKMTGLLQRRQRRSIGGRIRFT